MALVRRPLRPSLATPEAPQVRRSHRGLRAVLVDLLLSQLAQSHAAGPNRKSHPLDRQRLRRCVRAPVRPRPDQSSVCYPCPPPDEVLGLASSLPLPRCFAYPPVNNHARLPGLRTTAAASRGRRGYLPIPPCPRHPPQGERPWHAASRGVRTGPTALPSPPKQEAAGDSTCRPLPCTSSRPTPDLTDRSVNRSRNTRYWSN